MKFIVAFIALVVVVGAFPSPQESGAYIVFQMKVTKLVMEIFEPGKLVESNLMNGCIQYSSLNISNFISSFIEYRYARSSGIIASECGAICNRNQLVDLSPKAVHFHMFGKVLHTRQTMLLIKTDYIQVVITFQRRFK